MEKGGNPGDDLVADEGSQNENVEIGEGHP
jgi:hypothetical protein